MRPILAALCQTEKAGELGRPSSRAMSRVFRTGNQWIRVDRVTVTAAMARRSLERIE